MTGLKMKKKLRAPKLPSHPTFFQSMGRLLDLFGTSFEADWREHQKFWNKGFEADAASMRGDWETVGRDLQAAMGRKRPKR